MAEKHMENGNHRNWKTLGGALLFILGIVALNAAAVTSFALIYTLGWVLVIGGVIGFVMSFAVNNASGIILGIVSAILSFVLGVIMILNPAVSLATVTLLLALYFVVDGIIRIAVSFSRTAIDNRGISLGYGIIMLVLGVAIWAHWPASSLFIFGIFIGISLIIRGIEILATAVSPFHITSHRTRYA